MKKPRVEGNMKKKKKQRKGKAKTKPQQSQQQHPPPQQQQGDGQMHSKPPKGNKKPGTSQATATITTGGGSNTPKETISLGNKRPEGLTRGPGNTIFVSEMLFGGIKEVNVITGEIKQVVPSFGFKERGAHGIIESGGKLFVAGGGGSDGTPPKFYVYDAVTGAEIAACDPEGDASLLNDIAIVGDYAYLTDSFYNKLMVVNIPKALEGICDVFSIRTPEEYFLADDASDTRANGKCLVSLLGLYVYMLNHMPLIVSYIPPTTKGIIAYEGGLIIARTSPGGLYFLDLTDEDLPTIELASPDEAPRNDGLAIDGKMLYVTENTRGSISVWSLKKLHSRIMMMRGDPLPFVGRLQLPTVDFPAGVEIFNQDYLCVVDARLKSLPVTDEEGDANFPENFNMVCVGDRKDVDD